MTLSEVIAASRERTLNFADVESLLSTRGGSKADALDEIALDVARRYAGRQLDLGAADALANTMFAFAVQHACLGDTLHGVFLAFDAGEFVPSSDAAGTDAEVKYTRPQIAKIIAAVGRSNNSLERTREG